jgi:hypothetical protein
MKVLKWLQAYAIVYSRRLKELDSRTIMFFAALVFVAILALALGPLGTLVLGAIVIFVLPAINADVRSEVDDEYNKRK